MKTLETNANALAFVSNVFSSPTSQIDLKQKKLTLNVKKPDLLIFNINKSHDNNKMQIKLFIDKEELEQKDTIKYLAIYLGQNLTIYTRTHTNSFYQECG